MFTPIKPFANGKEALRLKLKAERKAAAAARPDAAVTAARHAARHFMSAIAPQDNAVVALYHPIRDELDPEPLFDALSDQSLSVALPVTPKRKGPLVFRVFAPGDRLVEDKLGIMVPEESAPETDPDIVLVPLLGFTRRGARLGYGGGYYDRTLAALRARKAVLAVGYAYGAQEVDALPTTDLDEPLDWVITEREAIRAA